MFTICARNYISQAVCLHESLSIHHPEALLTVWIVDDGEIPTDARHLNVRSIRELLPEPDFLELWVKYNVTEFSTAVKPLACLKHVEEGAKFICYLDPDIYFFAPMQSVVDAIDGGAFGVLTPHMFAPFPDDGEIPSDRSIVAAGTYNLGFMALGVQEGTVDFLNWWWRWLQTDCYSDLRNGTFTDQKWMNLAPCFWEGWVILQDRTVNAAYWNLHERSLTDASGGSGWLVDGKPLTFYHFSGFNAATPEVLSKHQTRYEPDPDSSLGRLLRFYADRMVANGHATTSRIGLSTPDFDDGAKWDQISRKIYNDSIAKGLKFTSVLGDGPGSFRAYLRTVPVGGTRGAYVSELVALRPDLEEAFGEDESAFIEWIRDHGRSEHGLEARLLEDGESKTPDERIAYVGYLRAALGVGQAARGYVGALRSQGCCPTLVDLTHLTVSNFDDLAISDKISAKVPDTVQVEFLHVNADQVERSLNALNPNSGNPWRIGMWAWETPDFPEHWHDSFSFVHEVWVGSSFMASALSKRSPIPVVNMPYVVTVPDVSPDRAGFGFKDDEFVFLFAFDFHSVEERKNPYATISAFKLAFTPEEKARLIIKTMHGSKHQEAFAKMKDAAKGYNIEFLDESLDHERQFQLIASCDAYVSLHRAEGFGLGMAEAMLYSKPVIGTGWSGNMEFMTHWNSCPIEYDLQPLEKDLGPYPKGTIWALPRISDAASKMRLVFEDAALRERIGARAKHDILTEFSEEAIGRRMVDRLDSIFRVLEEREAAERAAAELAAYEAQQRALNAQIPPAILKRRLLREAVVHPFRSLRRTPRAIRILIRDGVPAFKHYLVEIVR